jgi:hypothetical protein
MDKTISPHIPSNYTQRSLLKSVGLHILPGVLTTLAFLLLKPLLDPSGSPPVMAK